MKTYQCFLKDRSILTIIQQHENERIVSCEYAINPSFKCVDKMPVGVKKFKVVVLPSAFSAGLPLPPIIDGIATLDLGQEEKTLTYNSFVYIGTHIFFGKIRCSVSFDITHP